MADDQGLDEAVARMQESSRKLSWKPLEHLRDQVLLPGERVMALGHGHSGSLNGVVAMTTRRIVMVDKGFLGTQLKQVPLSEISSVKLEKGWIYATLRVTSAQSKFKIQSLEAADGESLAHAYQQLRHGRPEQPDDTARTATPATTAEEVFAQLEKLGTLREAGVLTEDEFTSKKTELLARL